DSTHEQIRQITMISSPRTDDKSGPLAALTPAQKPNSLKPAWSSGRRPRGQKYLRLLSAIGKSLMLAMRLRIRPCSSNSQGADFGERAELQQFQADRGAGRARERDAAQRAQERIGNRGEPQLQLIGGPTGETIHPIDENHSAPAPPAVTPT